MSDPAAPLLASKDLVRLGNGHVPVIRRHWRAGARLPYRKTYSLLPGQHWQDADEAPGQWEHYVRLDDGTQVPVGAIIARELIDQGASSAAFTEQWCGKCVLVSHELICISDNRDLSHILTEVRAANQGSLGGLPDVMATYRDGRVAFREAKNVRAKDRLGTKQHALADVLRRLYGARLDLAVVEWDLPDKPPAMSCGR